MESTKRAIKYQFFDSKSSILGFWLVILIVDIFFYYIDFRSSSNFHIGLSSDSNGIKSLSVVGSNFMAIFIYFIVYTYETYYQRFPIAISFSVTRKDFYKSMVIDNIFVALMFGLIQGILSKVDPIFVKAIGRIPLHDLSFINIKTDNLSYIIFSLSVIFLTFISFWNLMASLNYRFGYKMWIAIGVFSIIVPLIKMIDLNNLIANFGLYTMSTRIDLMQFLKLTLIIAICNILVCQVTIKTNIKHKVG